MKVKVLKKPQILLESPEAMGTSGNRDGTLRVTKA
jgi:hypothetical protein